MIIKGVVNTGKGTIEGVGTIEGGKYEKIRIKGVCTVVGDIEAESLVIDGVCTCSGSIEANELDCDGVITIEGNLRARTMDIDGVVTVNGNKVEADQIKCDGVLSVEGEISADTIDAEGKINAKEVVGDYIKVRSYWKSWGIFRPFFKLGEKTSMKFSSIDLIEGTRVELRGVRARSVNGQDVIIGRNCEIDRVEASGELQIHPSARIGGM